MTIKMIVSDLDNTLLKDDKTISAYTHKIIQQCLKQKIKFVPATARVLRKLDDMKVSDFLSYDALISSNGSQIYLDRTSIYQQGFNPNELQEILSYLLAHFSEKRITVEINNCSYANHHVPDIDPGETHYQRSNLIDLPPFPADRIIIGVNRREEIDEIARNLPDFAYIHGVSDSPIARILHRRVSKANAIAYLCEFWNITPEEIVCFGDDANDLEMFDFCKSSVAMSNAIEELKSKATHHTLSCNEDGVAKWIEENILKPSHIA